MVFRKEIIFNCGRELLATVEEILYGDNGITIWLSKGVNYYIPYASIAMIKSIEVD